MTQTLTTTADRPIVGAYGDVYTAPVGTAPPTDPNNVAVPWIKLGLISEDGAAWTPPAEETTDIKSWQSMYPVRIVTTGLTTSVKFSLMEWDRDTVPFAMGGGYFEDTATSTIFHPPAAGEAAERALFIKVLDDPVAMGIYYPKGRVSSREDTSFKKDEAALLGVTFAIVGDMTLEPYNLIFDPATFPAGIPATGAVAGTPGSFTPAGASAPANLAAMTGITATPATAWTTGQYVNLADNSKASWSGTAWQAGAAALAAQSSSASSSASSSTTP